MTRVCIKDSLALVLSEAVQNCGAMGSHFHVTQISFTSEILCVKQLAVTLRR